MPPVSTSRDAILRRIRQAAADHTDTLAAEYAAIPRSYKRQGHAGRADVLALLSDRLRDYDAGVYYCAPADIASTVAAAMAARGKTSLLRPAQLPQEWLPPAHRFPLADAADGAHADDDAAWFGEIDRSEGVITGCVTAIAFTGTIILRHGAGEGTRALTLIPDYHLCVVFADQVVETVPEGFERLRGMETSPLTTISGPSATADIEMTRVKGVHGPRFLDVILVD